MKVATIRSVLLGIGLVFALVVVMHLFYTDRAHHHAHEVTYRSGQYHAHDTGYVSVPTDRQPGMVNNNTSLHGKDTNYEKDLRHPKTPVEIAKDIFQKKDVVLFTMINDAYFDFAASWSCNTQHMDSVHQRTLFLTTDSKTGENLRSKWPGLSVTSLNSSDLGGAQTYSKAGYIRLMVERTKFIHRLLQAGVRLFLFEVDCIWLEDPTPTLLSRAGEGDILATKVTGQDVTAGGFLFLNPTEATVKLWQRLVEMMDNLYNKVKALKPSESVSEALNDQQFFTSLVKKGYAGIKMVYLSADKFPDGKWYEARTRNPKPFIINNNWVSGKEAKVKRAKRFGHWFWNEKEQTCSLSAIKNLFH